MAETSLFSRSITLLQSPVQLRQGRNRDISLRNVPTVSLYEKLGEPRASPSFSQRATVGTVRREKSRFFLPRNCTGDCSMGAVVWMRGLCGGGWTRGGF